MSKSRTDTRTALYAHVRRVAASLRLVLNHSPLLAAEAPTRFEESSPLQQLLPMICLWSGRGSGERVEEGVAVLDGKYVFFVFQTLLKTIVF